jgi:DNA mismatch endonuclease (patch repair protein)
MADVHDRKTRSYNMSRILAENTKPEIIVRKFLFSQGFRYKLHDKTLPGKPDIVLPKYRIAILVHGCFWHGHEGCAYFVVPKTRTDWWLDKINSNKERDDRNLKDLLNRNLTILTIFECQLRPKKRERTLTNLLLSLKQSLPHE